MKHKRQDICIDGRVDADEYHRSWQPRRKLQSFANLWQIIESKMAIFRRVTQFAARLTGCRRRFSGLIMIQFFPVFFVFFSTERVCVYVVGDVREISKKKLFGQFHLSMCVLNQLEASISHVLTSLATSMRWRLPCSQKWCLREFDRLRWNVVLIRTFANWCDYTWRYFQRTLL